MKKLTKKERLGLDREHDNLMKNLAGIREMRGLPDMLFVIDVRKEDIAVKEAKSSRNSGRPRSLIRNCSPEGVDHVIPGNDDALRAVRLFASRVADAILEGQQVATEGKVPTDNDQMSDDGMTVTPEMPITEPAEPTLHVADKTWETAAATHPISLQPSTEGKSDPIVGGVEDKIEVVPELNTGAYSEDVREVKKAFDEKQKTVEPAQTTAEAASEVKEELNLSDDDGAAKKKKKESSEAQAN